MLQKVIQHIHLRLPQRPGQQGELVYPQEVVAVALQFKLPGDIVFQILFLKILKRSHHRLVLCVILQTVIFQYQTLLLASRSHGEEEIHAVSGDMLLVLLFNVLPDVELGDDLESVLVLPTEVALSNKCIEFSFFRRVEDRPVGYVP